MAIVFAFSDIETVGHSFQNVVIFEFFFSCITLRGDLRLTILLDLPIIEAHITMKYCF